MKTIALSLTAIFLLIISCTKPDEEEQNNEIKGYELLTDLSGHWIGTNKTSFGFYDWFSFDFRPISASHLHSIYEGGTNQNIITSIFIADFEGKKQIMARNGGWLGNQYRATYFVLDVEEINSNQKYYRLVDAVGKENRAYMEFRFENDTMYFDAYKDNSGSLDQPIHHMGFKGINANASFANDAKQRFNFPQAVAEIDLENKFVNLIDPDSALFLEEANDPFPKSMHGHLSDLKINFSKNATVKNNAMLLYISKAPIINENGIVNFENLNQQVIRTIDILPNEQFYTATYLHPDKYFITAFTDLDGNFYPSTNDYCNISKEINVTPETEITTETDINFLLE